MKAIIKLLLLSICFVAFATCQTASFCDPQTLLATFVNGYNATTQREQIWHYISDHWDSTSVSSSFLSVGANDSWFNVQDLSPIDVSCYTGSTTDMDSHDSASFTWAFPNSTILLTREFYLPKATSWMRMIDTIHNNGTQSINAGWLYTTIFRSVPTYYELTNTFWVTSHGNSALSWNAAMSSVLPYQVIGFDPPGITQRYSYTDIIIPAGESKSIMTIASQYDSVEEALVDVLHIDIIPSEIFVDVTDVKKIINWVTCESSFVPPTQRFSCSSAFSPTFSASYFVSYVKLNDHAVSITNTSQFRSPVINGTNVVSFYISTGRSFTCQYDFIVPEQDLDISLDLTGATPVPSATGGYGGYQFNVTVSSDGLTALVNVMDQQGCTASREFDIPPPPVPPVPLPVNEPHSTPQVDGPQASPVNGPQSSTPLAQSGPVSAGRSPSKLLSKASTHGLTLLSSIISICLFM